jgi:hypothetical protein
MKMKNKNTTTTMTTMMIIITMIIIIAAAASVVSVGAPTAAATGQQQQQQQQIQTTTAAVNYYTDTTNGFRVQVPTGWIAVDTSMATTSPDLSEQERREVRELVGFATETVAHLCPETIAEPVIGGEYKCPVIADPIMIGISKYHFDLPIMQQFADIIQSGGNITTHDLLAYTLQEERGRGGSFDVTVVSEIDRTTNLVDPETNETITNNVPVKIVEYTYSSQVTRANNLPNEIKLMLFAVYNDPESDEVAGYTLPGIIMESADVEATSPDTLANIPEVKQVLDSFELVLMD